MANSLNRRLIYHEIVILKKVGTPWDCDRRFLCETGPGMSMEYHDTPLTGTRLLDGATIVINAGEDIDIDDTRIVQRSIPYQGNWTVFDVQQVHPSWDLETCANRLERLRADHPNLPTDLLRILLDRQV